MEKKSLFHDVTYAMIGNYWLVNYDILWIGCSDTKKYFNLELKGDAMNLTVMWLLFIMDSAYVILVLCSRQVLVMFKDHLRK